MATEIEEMDGLEKIDAGSAMDGWNKEAAERIGLNEFLEQSAAIQYEVKNCGRNKILRHSFGDGADGLIETLRELSRDLSEVLEKLEYETEEALDDEDFEPFI